MNLKDNIIKLQDPLRAALDVLRGTGSAIVLFTDKNGQYAGVLTDQDLRDILISSPDIDKPCAGYVRALPIAVSEDAATEDMLIAMDESAVDYVVVTDKDGVITGLKSRFDFAETSPKPEMKALLMAGGFGKRLYPLTNDMPKPMLRIGNKPMLEHIISKISAYGVEDITISTHYLPEKITEHFGDGSDFGVNVSYVHEDTPLGTGGALGLLEDRSKPLLMMNGDILTGLNVRAFYDFHVKNGNDISVAARPYEFQVPYGVINVDDNGAVNEIVEKPVKKFLISGGVYILSPSVYKDIKEGEAFDLPDLVEKSIQDGKKVNTFLMWEYWLDIGKRAEYDLAQTFISHREAA